MKRQESSVCKGPIGWFRWAVLAAYLAAIFLCSPAADATELHFINLQQDGTAVLVIQDLPDGSKKFILVDTGRHSVDLAKGAAKVKEYLQSAGIPELHYVILTHIDADHAEGLKTLLREHPTSRGPPVHTIVEPSATPPTRKIFYGDLKGLAKARGIPWVRPGMIDEMRILESYGIQIHSVPWENPRNTNDTSLVVKVRDTVTGRDHLLTGDMTKRTFDAVKANLPGSVSVLHAPHHGGDPVVLDVLRSVETSALVIQANHPNRYGHPRVAVMRDLARMGFESIDEELRESRQRLFLEQEGIAGEIAESATVKARSGMEGPARAEAYLQRLGTRSSDPAGRGRPLSFDRVLITGEVGNIVVTPEGVRTEKLLPASHQLLLEASWNELKYMSDGELKALKNFREVQAYGVLKAKRFLEAARSQLGSEYWRSNRPVLREPWLLELERLVARAEGVPSLNRALVGPAVERFFAARDADTVAQSLVGSARSEQLLRAAVESHQRELEAVMWDHVRAAWQGKRPDGTDGEFRSFRSHQEEIAQGRGKRMDLRELEEFAGRITAGTLPEEAIVVGRADSGPDAGTRAAPGPPGGPGPKPSASGTPSPGAIRSTSPHVVYFYFMPSGCPHCRSMADEIERLHQASKKGDVKVEVYGVPIVGPESTVEDFRRSTGLSIPIVKDPGLDVNTSRHPITVGYDRSTRKQRILAEGDVSYDALRGSARRFVEGRESSAPTPPRGRT